MNMGTYPTVYMRHLFWKFALEGWMKRNFYLTDLWHAYEQMRGKPIAGAHFIGKMYGDC